MNSRNIKYLGFLMFAFPFLIEINLYFFYEFSLIEILYQFYDINMVICYCLFFIILGVLFMRISTKINDCQEVIYYLSEKENELKCDLEELEQRMEDLTF